MPILIQSTLVPTIQHALLERNAVGRAFFACEAHRLAVACREMADRFARGGRLLAVGRLHSATDAQHVSVEFVHPVIVGKRALPAIDLSHAVQGGLTSVLRPDDIVMGFGPPGGDPVITDALRVARGVGAQTFALPGREGSYVIPGVSADPYIHQEIVEVLYHTLWETVHVFLEHRQAGHDVGASGFLYPYLGDAEQDTTAILGEVADSIRAKAAMDEELRKQAAESAAMGIAEAAAAIRARLSTGATILAFGNGGSATDANDFALDCALPIKPRPAIPAMSLSTEPAVLTAIANDVGHETVFLRQVIAHGRRGDVALGISTSGGSRNVLMALEEARRRGMLTVALLGYDGGEIVRRGLADIALVVSSDYIPRIQEVQASMYHTLIDALYDDFGEEADGGAAA